MYNTPLRQRQRLRDWAISIAIVAALVAGVFLWLNHIKEQDAQKRAAMANTKVVYVADPVQKLVKHADGSYYAEDPNTGTYEYKTVEDHDVVVPKSVSVKEQREQPQFLWHHLTFTNDIEVRIIDPHEADRTPRLERLRCTVKPIDPSKPRYTGDPHDTNFSGRQQLCQDQITILVPDGSIQP
ncbi:hypothetical protein ACF082_34315 [Streptomyces lydicus]|uniref:hypothetical protein n=1 Tax=Streptomyces lydicus TaxID=47763 RepID=UPI00370180C7